MKTRQMVFASCVILISAVAFSNWQPTNTFSATFPNTFGWDGEYLYAGTYWGVFVSSNNGTHWYRANSGLGTNPNVIAFLSVRTATESYVFAGCGGSVFVTTNRGAQWNPANTGFPVGSSAQTFLQLGTDILASTDVGVYRSTNLGGQWTLANTGLPTNAVQDFAVSGSKLFGAAGWSGLYQSTNNGTSWTRVTVISDYVPQVEGKGNNLFVVTDQRCYYSTDGGATWVAGGQPLIGPSSALIIQETGSTLAHALYTAGSYSASSAFSRSLDSGKTWTTIDNGLPQYRSGSSLIAVGSPTNNTLFGGVTSILLYPTENGIFRSTNQGLDWSISNAGLSQVGVSALTGLNEYFLAGTTYYDLMRSSDRGQLWRLNLPYFYGYTHTKAFLFKGSRLFCGNERGLFTSTDFGATWIGSGFANDVAALGLSGNRIILASGNNMYFSTNDGANWTVSASGLPGTAIVSIQVDSSSSPTKIFVGTQANGIYVSADFGAFWTSSPVGIPANSSVRAMTSVMRNGIPTLIAGLNSGVYASTDRGASWSLQSNAVTDVRGLTSNNRFLFAGSGNAGIFLSTNGGTSWSAVNTGLGDQGILSLLIYNSKLYAGTSGTGLWERPLSEFEPTEVQDSKALPTEFLLSQNYPNPFNPSTTINISIPTQSDFTLTIYDILGREVKSFAFERVPAGVHSVVWDGKNKAGLQLASGVYFYRLMRMSFVSTKKLIFQK